MAPPPDLRPTDSDPVTTYDVGPEESLSDAVLRAAQEPLDDLTDVRPLSSIVDVESLDLLFERRRATETDENRVVAFVAWGLWFVVSGTSVEIYETDDHFGR
jgi:hypothetical protein